MDTNQILASALAFSGLFAGMAIAYFAKEELWGGKRYFLLMQKILIIIIFAIFLNYLQLNTHLKLYCLFPFFACACFFFKEHAGFFNTGLARICLRASDRKLIALRKG